MRDLINRQDAIDVARKCPVKEVTPAYMLIDKSEIMTELMLIPSAEPERKCKSCRYRNLEWYEEPCDSCTMGGEDCHYKPERKKV